MQEFIKKLIGRLEEKENEAVLKAPNTSDISNIEYQKWMMKSYGFKESIEIVNQLTEEYNNESVNGDLISRSATIKALEEGAFVPDWNLALAQAIVSKQPAAYNDGWIPCEKELPPMPKENPLFENRLVELYLVVDELGDYPYRAFWNGKDFTDGFGKVDATHWQPLPNLPQPYKENENERLL